ncbi:MAG: cysteine desulfurase, partial [Chloroflexota bacterium]|nr:cysteine desulfurase [Chloroflexota bacterium]
MSSIYLDHAATTPLDPVVLQAMLPYLTHEFGNPSSIYSLGQSAHAAIQSARQDVARITGFDPAEVVFTSGSTESIRTALTGVAWSARKRGIATPHIVTTAIEHSAVLETAAWLESAGFASTRVHPNSEGIIDPDDVIAVLTPDTVLVSVMAANNEVGSLQPVREIGELLRKRAIPFHVDATQAAGTLPIDRAALGASLLSISAHKFYGPKGVGVLAVDRSVPLDWAVTAGSQEGGKRGGTENVAGIVGLGTALTRSDTSREAYAEHCRAMRDRLWAGIQERIPDVELNGPPLGPDRLPSNLNLRIPGLQGETMLVNLDLMGIAASAGSACTVGR